MREFVLPFKPEELLAQPSDGRLWAQDLPPVDEWTQQQANKALDSLIGRLLKSGGLDVAGEESFSLLFALLQAWPRVDEPIRPRVVDLLVDAARRVQGEVAKLKAKNSSKQKDKDAGRDLRTASKVSVFFLRWAAERVVKQQSEAPMGGRGRGRGGKGSRRGAAANEAQEASIEEAKEAQKALERLRCATLLELAALVGKGPMAWLWQSDPAAWQQVAQSVSDAGFIILDNTEAMKHRETRSLSLRCISEPLLQEGHQHSNLLVATVSKLMHGLRSGEGGAPFAADALLLAHTTPLPRLFLVELPQHCNGAELSSQGAFQRSLASFLVAATERLPHVVLANISVLLPLLDVDCYPLRSAIVESIGALLSAQGRKLPSGAHCDSGAGAPGQEQNPEEGAQPVGEEGNGNNEEMQAIVVKDKSAPVAYFSISTSTKKDLLETLVTRSLDKSVWVRYRVLQTLVGLAANTKVVALPREQWARVLEIATRRMQDTASTTRKASMQLVRTLIEFHPYGPALQGSGDEREKAKQLLQEVAIRFQKLNAEEAGEAEEELKAMGGGAGDENEDGEAPKRKRLKAKTVTGQTVANEIDRCLAEEDAEGDPREERQRQREALIRMRDCYTQRLQFVELIDSAETRLRALLASRTNTDVTEAMSVVVQLRLKGVPAATKAFDQVLGLVWSRHVSIKDAAVDAFYRMHLEGREAADAVRSLLEMYQQGSTGGSWTYTHMASVQELIQQSAEKDLIDVKASITEFVSALRGPACPMALRALTALGGASASHLAAELPRIAEALGPDGVAVGKTASEQLERARLVCQLLARLHTASNGKLDGNAWSHIWSLSQHAICLVVESFSRADVPPQWFSAAQAAMDLSFDLSLDPSATDVVHQCPDKLWEQILGRMLCSFLNKNGSVVDAAPICDGPASGEESNPREGEAVVEAAEVQAPKSEETVSSSLIGCVVFLAGHLALRMLIYLETLQSAIKKKRLADEDARMAEQRENNKKKPKNKKKGGKAEEEEDEGKAGAESSMGMAGQEEREADAFNDLAENGIVYGTKSLLDRIKPLIFACLLDPTIRNDPVLRRLGAISLCKYMTVSKRFCEENLQLLFSILFPKGKDASAPLSFGQGSDAAEGMARGGSGMAVLLEDLTLRQSLLVAVGDLLFRHPNVVEPWTGRLYATLGSTGSTSAEGSDGRGVAELRLTALLVLTHLVLNDMMKPRAVLLARALWLTACTHESTARVARIMFQELSKRSTNVVYNLLPQIIASMPDHQDHSGTVTGGAEERVQYVMQFVDKEKHIEGLIEKLTVRLEQAANITGGTSGAKSTQAARTQGEDDAAEVGDDTAMPARAKEAVSCLSHALGAMNYTDRCILRLHDAVVVRKALHTAISYNEVTRECLLSIVEKGRKAKQMAKDKAGADGPAPEAEGAAPAADGGSGGGKGGVSAAAAAALDAIETTVVGLAKGREEDPDQPREEPADDGAAAEAPEAAPAPEPTPAPVRGAGGRGAGKGGRGAKRKAEEAEADNPGFEEESAKKGGGRGRGAGGRGGRGRGRGPAAAPQEDAEPRGGKGGRGGGRGAGAGGKKRKAARGTADDEDYE